jgi:hypothetical protein
MQHSLAYPYCDVSSRNSYYPYNPQAMTSTASSNDIYSYWQTDCSQSLMPNFEMTTTLQILTTRNYSYPSFVSHVSHALSNFVQQTIVYVDDDVRQSFPMTNNNNNNSTNIVYLICFDQYHADLQQALDTAILNQLNTYSNYFFLLLNAPSHQLIAHLYDKVPHKRTILVLHYHWTFDNAPLLLCSGDRQTFDTIRSSILTCLCSKVKYIDDTSNNNEPLYSTAVFPSTAMPMTNMIDDASNFHSTLIHTNNSDDDVPSTINNEPSRKTLANDMYILHAHKLNNETAAYNDKSILDTSFIWK